MRTAGELTLTSDDPEVFLYEGADVPAEKVNKDAKLVVKHELSVPIREIRV